MSTYANGTQQTYQQIWANMERSCAGMMAVLRAGAPQTDMTTGTAADMSTGTGTDEVTPAAVDWAGLATSGHRRKHPLRMPRRSARGRRLIAARTH